MHASDVTIVWISKEVTQAIYDETEKRSPLETGGCLLGYWNDSFKEFVIEQCIGPGPNARHSKYGFKPDSKWQEAQIARIYKESGNLWTYLGDWHSHPNGPLTLSSKDKWTLSKISNYTPARVPHPLMILVSSPPWQIKAWKANKTRWFSFKLVISDCEIIIFP